MVQSECSGERGAANPQDVWNATGCDQELVIADFSTCGGYDLFGGIDGEDASVKPKINRIITIKALWTDEDLCLILASEQEPLGQGRMMIRRQFLRR